MTLDQWLTKNRVTSGHFAKQLGLSRQTIWNVRQGMACDENTAYLINQRTKNQVHLNVKPKGRPKLMNRSI